MKYRLLIAAKLVALGVFTFLASLAAGAEGAVQSPAPKPDLATAKQIVDRLCAACHGADGNSVSRRIPVLRPARRYITLQLMHFQSGIRANAVMQAMVAKLTPEDMQALGSFSLSKEPSPRRRKIGSWSPPDKRSSAAAMRTADCLPVPRVIPRWSRHTEAISARGRPICRLYLGATEGVQGGRAWSGQGRQGRQRESDGSDRVQNERARNAGGGGVHVRLALT